MKRSASSVMGTALLWFIVIGLSALSVAVPVMGVQNPRNESPTGYITGVVQSSRGPEAGVWVIAETKDTPTPLTKIVVTNAPTQ